MRYVLFHSNCYDGFGAAFSCWKKFGEDNTKYIPVSYNEPLPELPDAVVVYIVDFSYPREILLELASRCQVILLDHHATAQKDLEGLVHPNLRIGFDMRRSGALITWEYLHETPAPALIQHISDRDLWQFKLPRSKEIHTALVSYPMDFKLWDSFDVETLKKEGAVCERLYGQLVDSICKKAWIDEIDGHKVAMVNTSIAWSEVGNELLKRYPDVRFAASFTTFEKDVMWSLRGRGDFDVSAVAKKFGGGGHFSAAGFREQRNPEVIYEAYRNAPGGDVPLGFFRNLSDAEQERDKWNATIKSRMDEAIIAYHKIK